MKQNIILLGTIACLLALPGLQSCKKGKDDPFISLRSRDSRLEGSYNLSGREIITTVIMSNGSSTTTSTTTHKYENGVAKTTTTGSSTVTESKYTLTCEFKKDGTFSYSLETFQQNGNSNGKNEGTGYWVWANTGKHKSSIEISIENNDNTGEAYWEGSWAVTQLKNKEIVLKRDTRRKYTSGGSSPTSTENQDTDTRTFEAK